MHSRPLHQWSHWKVQSSLMVRQTLYSMLSPDFGTGMPHPTNLTTALSLETIIRSYSAAPASIAILSGKVHVGLSETQLSQLADPNITKGSVKVSTRDLATTIALGRTGGTTVAGTMYVARSIGIKVFVTGGIGGVHRGAESSKLTNRKKLD